MRAVGNGDGSESGFCNACFTGSYPLEVGEAQAKLSALQTALNNLSRH